MAKKVLSKGNVNNTTKARSMSLHKMKLNVRADVIDFRDIFYTPTLREVPLEKKLDEYQKHKLPILNQGTEGACTGFGLAAVVNYLLRSRNNLKNVQDVSPWMLYDNARRYDEWQGENYDGSSARGAMKGWHKHGVCESKLWQKGGRLSREVAMNSLNQPLGAYYRIKSSDIVAMHCALTEVGILYATADVHTGWENVDKSKGIIPYQSSNAIVGGHAFAIVGYTREGFWIQNSWGNTWGKNGYALISYDDWLKNANDVWVAQLGVPISLSQDAVLRQGVASRQSEIVTSFVMRPHVVSIGNNGVLKSDSRFHNNSTDLQKRFEKGSTFEAITKGWKKKKIVLYAHGGLVDEKSALDTLSKNIKGMLDNELYPIMFVWHSGGVTTIGNILSDALKGKQDEPVKTKLWDWVNERWDESMEVLARPLGKEMWSEMKENAVMASLTSNGFNSNGGAYIFVQKLKELVDRDKSIEVHIVGHSAGSIFLGGVVEALHSFNIPIESCSLWAPACTVNFFNTHYVPYLGNHIKRCSLFTLSDKQERDDTASPLYRKSLLYLVSNSFEENATPFDDTCEEILGMEKYANSYAKYFAQPNKFMRVVGGKETITSKYNLTSDAQHHGDFDNDDATLNSTLKFIKYSY
ncbi:MAG: C1 family peptidase [Bacteriodetes bacterium]|nr:C1 family peptidase [Bacteroidota bacterium]